VSSYWERYWEGKTDGEHRYRTEDWFEKYARELLFHITSRREKQGRQGVLIDIGCGAAELTVYYEPFFDKIYGVDFSSSMLQAAQGRVDEFGSRSIQLVHGDAIDFAGKISTADVIISTEVAQYLSEEQICRHLNESLKILNPKGLIIISGIIDPKKYSLWKIGYFREPKTPLLKLVSRLLFSQLTITRRKMLQRPTSNMGYSHQQETITAICESKHLEVEFVNTLYFEYRYNALISRPT